MDDIVHLISYKLVVSFLSKKCCNKCKLTVIFDYSIVLIRKRKQFDNIEETLNVKLSAFPNRMQQWIVKRRPAILIDVVRSTPNSV